jgi:hypothetical protein
MIDQSHIRSILIFFRLSLSDEEKVYFLVNQACNKLIAMKDKSTHVNVDSEVIALCQKLLGKSSFLQKKSAKFSLTEDWSGPESLDMDRWSAFAATTSSEIVSSVIWCLILEIDYSVVAQALNVSQGTLRLRLSLAVRKMGAIITKNSARTLLPV